MASGASHSRPGETQSVSFALGAPDLAFHDSALDLVVEPGFFRVFVGTSSDRVDEARFELVDQRQCRKRVLSRRDPRFTWPAKRRAWTVQCR